MHTRPMQPPIHCIVAGTHCDRTPDGLRPPQLAASFIANNALNGPVANDPKSVPFKIWLWPDLKGGHFEQTLMVLH